MKKSVKVSLDSKKIRNYTQQQKYKSGTIYLDSIFYCEYLGPSKTWQKGLILSFIKTPESL